MWRDPAWHGRAWLAALPGEREHALPCPHWMAHALCPSTPPSSRPMRPGEVDGKDYFFVSKEVFEGWVQAGLMLEWAMVYGEYKVRWLPLPSPAVEGLVPRFEGSPKPLLAAGVAVGCLCAQLQRPSCNCRLLPPALTRARIPILHVRCCCRASPASK